MSEQADNLTRVEYQQRLQPQREPGGDAFAALLAAFATVLGLAAFWLAPFKTGIAVQRPSSHVMPWMGGPSDRSPWSPRNFQTL